MKLLITDSIGPECMHYLKKYNIDVDTKFDLSTADLQAIIGNYDALIVRSRTKVSKKVIDAAHKLQVIGGAGYRVDNIDLEAANNRGIMVLNAPTANVVSTAEYTIAMLMAITRKIPQANTSLHSGIWQRNVFYGTQISNKTLGVIGLGRVGSQVAKLANGLQMNVIAYDPMVSTDYARGLHVELVSLIDFLARSDFITVHVPLNPTTKGLIGASELKLVKPTVQIVNCAREGIIDDQALLEALERGDIAAAAIDVFSQETSKGNALLGCDKVIATPQLAAYTLEAESNTGLAVAEQVLAVLNGMPAKYPVNAPSLPLEVLQLLGPYIDVATTISSMSIQMVEGQLDSVIIRYEGEIANYETRFLKAAILSELLKPVSEERVNIVNADLISASRGIQVIEEKSNVCENYTNMLIVETHTTAGVITLAGTLLHGKPHIVLINTFWLEINPIGGYMLFTEHSDRPGMVGAVSSIIGAANVNISNMQVCRDNSGPRAMMAVCIDDPLPTELYEQILSLPDIYSAKIVKLE
ncbi:phosphoglycerate dehydrogenase [Chloroflexota bacterium]